MKSNNYLSILCPYWAVILLLIFTSCASQHIVTKNSDGNVPIVAAKKIFKKIYNDDLGVKYDSSYTVGNCVIYRFNQSARPRPLVVEVVVDSSNHIYNIFDRDDVESMVMNNNFRLLDVDEMNKFLKLYFYSAYDCYNYPKDSINPFKHRIKYVGSYIESKSDFINIIKRACFIRESTCDSLMKILPPIKKLMIQCNDDGCIYNGCFFDTYTFKLYLLKMEIYRNGMIGILEESEILDIEKDFGKLQRAIIM